MITTIDAANDGITVKELLYKNGISRGMITHLKKLDNGITVNGAHVTVRHVLRTGDVLALSVLDRAEDENELLKPCAMPLDIIYEDSDMIAVNKPPNMATHPSLGHFDDTLANGLAHYFSSRGIPFVFRAVNRLDRDTSGVVLIAKNRVSAAKLTALMQSGGIRKTYTAVLGGVLSPRDGTVTAAIRRRDNSIMLREACRDDENGAKSAVTVYKTLASCTNASIVQAEPITGRTHQLRVHFAHMGAPIVGDGLYGTAETIPTEYDALMTRQALHASSLQLTLDGKVMRFDAALPDDMQSLCDKINRKAQK